MPRLLRYVDDFLLFGDDKRQLWAWKRQSISALGACAWRSTSASSMSIRGDGHPVSRLSRLSGPSPSQAAATGGFGRRLRRCAGGGGREMGYEELHAACRAGWRTSHGDTRGLRRALLAAVSIPREGDEESPIFTRTYDLLRWLLPLTVKFPRQQRFVLAAALQRPPCRFQERLIEAPRWRSRRRLPCARPIPS